MTTPDFLESLAPLPLAERIGQLEGAIEAEKAVPLHTPEEMALLRVELLRLQREAARK